MDLTTPLNQGRQTVSVDANLLPLPYGPAPEINGMNNSKLADNQQALNKNLLTINLKQNAATHDCQTLLTELRSLDPAGIAARSAQAAAIIEKTTQDIATRSATAAEVIEKAKQEVASAAELQRAAQPLRDEQARMSQQLTHMQEVQAEILRNQRELQAERCTCSVS